MEDVYNKLLVVLTYSLHTVCPSTWAYYLIPEKTESEEVSNREIKLPEESQTGWWVSISWLTRVKMRSEMLNFVNETKYAKTFTLM